MAKEEFITEKKNNLYKVNSRWYSKCIIDHLHETIINSQPMLLEYYKRYSSEEDNKLLNSWSVWLYGNDRPQNPPHCHLILGNPSKPSYNIEVHLHDLEVYHMEAHMIKNISWNDVDVKLKDGFFQWLQLPNRQYSNVSNLKILINDWDGNNVNNQLINFIEKKHLNNNQLHPWIKEELFGKPIDTNELIGKIFEILIPIYQKDRNLREKFHNIQNPIELAQTIGLPFTFTEYNSTPKIKDIIKKHEKMCYQMTS